MVSVDTPEDNKAFAEKEHADFPTPHRSRQEGGERLRRDSAESSARPPVRVSAGPSTSIRTARSPRSTREVKPATAGEAVVAKLTELGVKKGATAEVARRSAITTLRAGLQTCAQRCAPALTVFQDPQRFISALRDRARPGTGRDCSPASCPCVHLCRFALRCRSVARAAGGRAAGRSTSRSSGARCFPPANWWNADISARAGRCALGCAHRLHQRPHARRTRRRSGGCIRTSARRPTAFPTSSSPAISRACRSRLSPTADESDSGAPGLPGYPIPDRGAHAAELHRGRRRRRRHRRAIGTC